MTICINSSGTVTLDARLKAAVPASDYALSASLSSEVDSIVSELERTGKLPSNLPVALRDKMAASLKKYFGKISSAKIQQFTDRAAQIIQDTLRTVEEDRGAGVRPAEVGLNPATSRSALTGFLEEATGGAIGDFMNVGFFLRIAREVVQGGQQYVAQNWDAVRVDEFPALELHRVFDREIPRGSEKDPAGPTNGWDDDDGRWTAACEESGDDDAAAVFESTGRCVALKDSDVWQALGDGAGGYDDTLGNPFAPFAFNSGWDTDEVSRKETEALGLLDEGEEAKPANVDFGTLFDLPDDLEARCAKWQEALQAEDAGHEFHGNQWTGAVGSGKHVTDSPEFKEWFGKSKVTGDDGSPLVVYKAMYPYDWHDESKTTPLTTIDRKTEFPAFNHGEKGVKIAGFFGDKDVANRFGLGAGGGQGVYPAYLSFQKPYVIDAKGSAAGTIQFEESGRPFRAAIRSGKYDSVIIKNTKDEGTVYVALKPTQIKSIFNKGKWSKADPDISARSAIEAGGETSTKGCR